MATDPTQKAQGHCENSFGHYSAAPIRRGTLSRRSLITPELSPTQSSWTWADIRPRPSLGPDCFRHAGESYQSGQGHA